MILESLFPRSSNPPAGDDFWYQPLLAGRKVTPDSAMQVATVMACVRVLAEGMASLPLHLMRDTGRMREKATDLELYRVLHSQPNRRHTSFEFREMMQAHLCLRGNAYALISTQGGMIELIPLHPDRMQVFVLDTDQSRPDSGRVGYLYRDLNGRQYKLTQGEVLHIRGMSFDGVCGVSPITYGRRVVELAEQAEEHGLKWWKNAAKPGGVIKMPSGEYLDEDAHKRMKASWRSAHTGEDLYTVAILEGGAEWQAMGISNEDSQWLESRRYQTVEICRLLRVSPHMIYSAIEHGNTYANIEQSDLDFVKHSLLPYIVRWEQVIQRDLILDDNLYAKFSIESMLRADSLTRKQFYEGMVSIGVYTINDILELEDRNPVEGGNNRFIQSSLVPLESAGQPVAATGDETMAAWLSDATERIVNAETRELERRLGRQVVSRRELLEWASEFYGTKHRAYVSSTLAPILAAGKSRLDSAAVAGAIVDSAITDLQENEPTEVLNSWRAGRAKALTSQIMEGLTNG